MNDRTVRVYQSRLLADEFVYHNIINVCHTSAYLSSMQGFVRLRESQAQKLGGRLCSYCARRLARRATT